MTELSATDAAEGLRELRQLAPTSVDESLRELMASVGSENVARGLLDLENQELADLLARSNDATVADLLAELDPAEGATLLLRLTRVRAADVLEEMDPDDAADIVQVVEERDHDIAEDLLDEMDAPEATDVRELLAYPAETAGGLMTTRVLTVQATTTVQQALAAVRGRAGGDRAELVYYLYVTDVERVLKGVLSLRELVLSRGSVVVAEVMRTTFASVPPEADQEEVARLINSTNLLAVPVLDDGGRLLGIITADDIADVIEEEATEDIHQLGGSRPLDVSYTGAGVLHLARKRVGWLLFLFLAEMYTGTVLRAFENELQAVVALTFFIPLLIGTGGNVGSQVVTTIVRAQALGEVAFRDMGAVVWKEIRVAMLLAAAIGTIAFVRAWVLDVGVDVQLTVALSIMLIVGWAATIGAVLPLVLRRLRVDPAVVSAPFITTLVDGTGLIIYFEMAKLFLF